MENLEIQVSSTTLGNPYEKGPIGAGIGLIENKAKYTETVINNARTFEDATAKEFPKATFGVSILASSVNPEQMKDLIRSIDYPYSVKVLNRDFLTKKSEKAKSEGYIGIGKDLAIAQEIAYGLLQAHSDEEQVNSTLKAVDIIEKNPIRIRTCVETVSLEEELKKIKEVNTKLKDKGKSATWILEPNKNMGDKNLADFLNRVNNIKRFNPSLHFGVDLDLGGLPEEERNHLQILEKLNANELFPIFLSLSGREYLNGDVRSHLPLGNDEKYNKDIGEWFKMRLRRGQQIPGIVIETSPARKPLTDYKNFLKAFKSGFIS